MNKKIVLSLAFVLGGILGVGATYLISKKKQTSTAQFSSFKEKLTNRSLAQDEDLEDFLEFDEELCLPREEMVEDCPPARASSKQEFCFKSIIEIDNFCFDGAETKELRAEMATEKATDDLYDAIAANDIPAVKKALSEGATLYYYEREAADYSLIYALEWGHLDVAKVLLDNGANIEAKGELHRTSLILYSVNNDKSVEKVKFLLDNGANINATDYIGDTALMVAASSDNVKIINGLAIHQKDSNLDIVQFLIARGANVNIKNQNGKTALIQAAEIGNVKVVEALINAGADLNVRDKKQGFNLGGKLTALGWAIEKGHEDIEKLLRSHGAKE